MLEVNDPCATHPCDTCIAIHRPLVERFVARGAPIHLVLPAFPAKSPNPHATLGVLPDFGEELALAALQRMCDEIAQIYPPGARLTICSDGRVFADLVGVTDADVTAYSVALHRLISRLGLSDIDTFSMDDIFGRDDPASARADLEDRYADSLEEIRRRAGASEAERGLFNGIHRFLLEDLIGTWVGESRTQLRKEAKNLAYRVVQRSHAWSRVWSRSVFRTRFAFPYTRNRRTQQRLASV